jgi:hypothetical protein
VSKAEEFEDKIREKRILEATKKGLMGQNGKIGIVLKILGQPIINQSEGGYYTDSNYIDLEGVDFTRKSIHEIENSEELMRNIPIMGMDGSERPTSSEWASEMPDAIHYGIDTIGMHFDGLSRGMHLEIKYDEVSSELVLYYKGYVAYKEIKGELLSYAPNEEWEKWIESLYKVSKEKQRKIKEKEFEESIKENEKEKSIWWEKIKNRWGLK